MRSLNSRQVFTKRRRSFRPFEWMVVGLVEMHEQGTGVHSITNYPLLIGGGAGGQFRMGELIDFTRVPATEYSGALGRPLSNLFMSTMRALGVSANEYLLQGEDGAFGAAPSTSDRFAQGDGSNYLALRRETYPYFYTGT